MALDIRKGGVMYYSRLLEHQINTLKQGFPVLSLVGPRQSGKTTLLQHSFPDYTYLNLENPQTLKLAEADPLSFLEQGGNAVIIDEIQKAPHLLSYIQARVDQSSEMGRVIVSGSQNLLISEKISQSLAGRAAYLLVLPFSMGELITHKLLVPGIHAQLWQGFYPAIYTRKVTPPTYYSQYIATYVERDARLIRNITDLSQFRIFISLLAGRVGQLVNMSSLASDTGISPNTAEDWLSLLEASFIAFRLRPYFKNSGKRLVKSPKVYFHDTGLLCSLLNIASPEQLKQHYAMGSLFENFIVAEFIKHNNNAGLHADLYFYRDGHGNEIDLVVDLGTHLVPIEVKSATTFNKHFFDGFEYWHRTIDPDARGYVLYGGDQSQSVAGHRLISWRDLPAMLAEVIK